MSKTSESVFKITSEILRKNYSQPWTHGKKTTAIGTGFCVALRTPSSKTQKKYILTNAHVVEGAKIVYITNSQSQTSEVTVEFVLDECDLAFVLPKKKKMISDSSPLEIGGIPSKGDAVTTLGYPLGGANVSVTKGVVSRIEIARYMGAVDGIAIQTDAAINPGSSGGPAINEKEEVVGVAFSGIDGLHVQNIGFLIPTTLIRFAIKKFRASKRNTGLCTFGVGTQHIDNDSMKEFLQLEKDDSGVLVTSADSRYGYPIEQGDVILAVNGVLVQFDGMVRMKDLVADRDDYFAERNRDAGVMSDSTETASFENFATLSVAGEKIAIDVMRSGRRESLEVRLKNKEFPVPVLEYQIDPEYFVVAGMVFVPLTVMLVREQYRSGEDVSHLESWLASDQSAVVLAAVFPSDVTRGFDDRLNVLASVSGRPVSSVRQLKSEVSDIVKKGTFLVFEYQSTSDIHVVSTAAAKKYSAAILREAVGDIKEWKYSK